MDAPGTALRRRRTAALSAAVVVALLVVIGLLVHQQRADQVRPGSSAATSAASSAPTLPTDASPRPTRGASSAAPPPPASVPAPTATGAPTPVADRPVARKEAGLSDRVSLGKGVTVRVSKLESVEGEARGPGEVAGPALQVRVEMANETSRPLATDSVLLNLYYGSAQTPADALSGPGVRAFPASVRAGGSASGTFVFKVPKDSRSQIEIEFSYTTDAPTVIFKGSE